MSENQTPTWYGEVVGLLSRYVDANSQALLRAHPFSPYACAVVHSCHDMSHNAVASVMDEEACTAALIGYLSANLAWYGLFRAASPEPQAAQADCLCWAYQSKNDEAERGGDFGLAIPVSNDLFNVAFFQAKLLTNSEKVDLWRPPQGYHYDPVIQEAADQVLREYLSGSNPAEDLDARKQHQIVKLARLGVKAQKIIPSLRNANWVRYVFWTRAPGTVPFSLSIDDIRAMAKAKMLTTNALSGALRLVPNSATRMPFSNTLVDGRLTSSRHWITVNLEQAKALVGELIKLSPNWFIVDETGQGGGQQLAEALKFSEQSTISSARSNNFQTPPPEGDKPAPHRPGGPS